MTADVIRAGKRLAIVARGGVGLDNIDLDAARENGIRVLNTPGASAVAVAELTLLHMLALVRRLPEADRSMKEGRWEKKTLRGGELSGKVLGVIGFGGIGREVAKRALAFDMTVCRHDSAPVDAPPLTDVCESLSLDDLLGNSDMVTLHIPHTEETHHLIGSREFARMKHGSFLVNCARGGVVDEAALAAALDEGRLAGAALDVFESEPPVGEGIAARADVIATPHLGAATAEAQSRVGEEIVERIVRTWQNIA